MAKGAEASTFLKSQKSFNFQDHSTFNTSLFKDKSSFAAATTAAAAPKPADTTKASFVSSVLDKAVMDNLDLTFTEVMKRGEPSRKPWARSKSHLKATETLFADELDKALAAIPEDFTFEAPKVRPMVRPVAKPLGILKNTKPTTCSAPVPTYNPEELAPLKSRLQQLRKNRAQASQPIPSTPELNQRLESLKVISNWV